MSAVSLHEIDFVAIDFYHTILQKDRESFNSELRNYAKKCRELIVNSELALFILKITHFFTIRWISDVIYRGKEIKGT